MYLLKPIGLIISLLGMILVFQNCKNFETLTKGDFQTDLDSRGFLPEIDEGHSDGDTSVDSPNMTPPNLGPPSPEILGGHLNQDVGLTSDPGEIELALDMEDQFFRVFPNFMVHILRHFTDSSIYNNMSVYTGDLGWAAYFSQDELLVLSNIIYITNDESHLEAYGEGAIEILNHLVSALYEGKQTEGCPATRTSKFTQCKKGHYRYLEAAHGFGSAGALLLAMSRRKSLNERYGAEIMDLVSKLVPQVAELEFQYKSDRMYLDTNLRSPHMLSKSAPGFYALGILLDRPEYLTMFWKHIDVLVKNTEENGATPKGWVGSDVSHANITIYTLMFAYQEKLRLKLESKVEARHLAANGDYFPTQLRTDIGRGIYSIDQYKLQNLGSYGAFLKLSPAIMNLYENKTWYQTAPRTVRGDSMYYYNIGSIAMGFAGNW